MEGVNVDSVSTNLEVMLRENSDPSSAAVATVQLLLEFNEKDDYTAIQGMKDNVQHVISDICTAKCSITCIRAENDDTVRWLRERMQQAVRASTLPLSVGKGRRIVPPSKEPIRRALSRSSIVGAGREAATLSALFTGGVQ
ncbi:hypothetical protein HPB49_001693 [Dermacentor silvarum]|uniref:Uncharacterized protein n=1 Tax=Dermacentor silvarum TaxID=543639 RepID=A0ACB8DT27_DERSI|nr:hypothetical protein HPB49_001693 [Dermacentor silvarum]